ncbi:MAG: DUF4373 domain-containing protein [Clostridia bacterium]|nr:DUF4373 domain-containing protein [Clostridia bacterium]
MARPLKKGLDYFPLQTNIFTTSSELAPLLNRFDGFGLLVYLHILCDIYQNGYYLKVPFMDDYKASIRKSINCPDEVVDGAIDLLKRLKILTFIEEKEYVVITSKGIQKRYLEVVKDRKRSLENLLKKFKNEYWLLSDEEVQEKCPKLTENVNSDVKRGKTLIKREFSGEKPPFSGDKAGIKCTNKGLLSFHSLSSESISMKEVNDKYETMDRDSKLGYAEEIEFSDNPSLGNKDLDEFDEETEREKREKELGEKLGLSPKLERMKPGEKGDPTAAPKLEFDLEGYERFSKRWGLKLANTANLNGVVYEIKWDEVSKKLEQSKWLREKVTMDFIFRHYREILDGRYDDYEKGKPKTGHELFMELIDEIGEDESGGEKRGDEK